MQSLWKGSDGTLSLNMAPRESTRQDDSGRTELDPMSAMASPRCASGVAGEEDSRPSFHHEEVPYLGPTVVPHHESSVRCVAHRIIQSTGLANAYLGMESGEIISLLDEPDANGDAAQGHMRTEKLGEHKAPISALLIFRETLISADVEGSMRLWDLREGASPRLRCTMYAAIRATCLAPSRTGIHRPLLYPPRQRPLLCVCCTRLAPSTASLRQQWLPLVKKKKGAGAVLVLSAQPLWCELYEQALLCLCNK